jgi:MoxR-like ATPase
MQENQQMMNTGLDTFQALVERAKAEIGKVIIGQQEAIDQALIVILVRQHALIEGVPGIAKTLLTRTLAHVLGCSYGRIQFTPDLMPADITGTNVFNLQRNEFTLVRGPIFTTFLLADEINRAPAKTQSALLQAMQERAVSIDRETIPLSPDFTVFATQNPVEFEGTYPLPEAQKDRFMLKISMSWPEREEEFTLADRMLGSNAPEASLETGSVEPILGGELDSLRAAVAGVLTRPELVQYVVDVVRATRNHEGILLGAGPRATQALVLASRARAALNGRDFVTPDDVRVMARPVLDHRLILRPESEVEGVQAGELIEQILAEIPVPR